jgi:hypothetical protein
MSMKLIYKFAMLISLIYSFISKFLRRRKQLGGMWGRWGVRAMKEGVVSLDPLCLIYYSS